MAAEVNGEGPSFQVGQVKPLFAIDSLSTASLLGDDYAVTRDGKRFLAITTGGESSMPLTIVSNWTLELKDK
jgi:hypothetical protein